MATLADGTLPSSSDYLSDEAKKLLIEKFTGQVDRAFISASIMSGFLPVMPVIGTDTISVRRFGNTKPRRVTPGVRPGGDSIETDKVTLTVTTHIVFRNFFSKLGEVQQDIDMAGETARNHGQNMAKLFDTAVLIMAYRGSKATVGTNANTNVTDHTLNGAFFDGVSVALGAAGDETDPDKLVDGLDGLITKIKERDMPLDGFAIFVRPSTYKVISDHPKLINQDYSQGNGNYAWRMVKVLAGVPIVETPRILSTATEDYKTLFNNTAYSWTEEDAKVEAIIFHRDGLLIGESLVEESNIFYSDMEKTWVVDTDRAFDIAIRNPGLCYSLMKATA